MSSFRRFLRRPIAVLVPFLVFASMVLGLLPVPTALSIKSDTALKTRNAIPSNLDSYHPMSLGNLVWKDINNNGIVDSGEPGIGNVIVNLYHDENLNGSIDNGELSATQTTTIDGLYRFDALSPGDYLIQLDPDNFVGNGVLLAYTSSTGNVGSNTHSGGPYEPAPDPDATELGGEVDNDDNGTAQAHQGIISAAVTLTAGGEPINAQGETLDPNSNMTIDIGVFRAARLGSRVWEDINHNGLRDASERGINGVTVTLYDQNDSVLTSTFTQNNGFYEFTDLAPGTYSVGFSDLPPGYAFTAPNQGGDDGSDSDVDPSTGRTSSIVLNPGDNDPYQWAGLFPIPTAIDLNSFTVAWEAQHVVIHWETSMEFNTRGFHIVRSSTGNRSDAVDITAELIAARGRISQGATYQWADLTALPGTTYTYWLVEVETNGATHDYGPVRLIQPSDVPSTLFLPMMQR